MMSPLHQRYPQFGVPGGMRGRGFVLPHVPADVFWDPEWFCPFAHIQTEQHGVQPFVLQDQQVLMARAYYAARKAGKWLVHVKPRKEGSSTFFSSMAFQEVMFKQGCRAVILAHKRTLAASIASKVMLAWKRWPEAIRPARNSKATLTLQLPDMASGIYIGGVKDDEPERGETNQFILATEISSWQDTKSQAAWVACRSSLARGGMLVAESTPKSADDPLGEIFLKEAPGAESKLSLIHI